jgi:hypothetical protein
MVVKVFAAVLLPARKVPICALDATIPASVKICAVLKMGDRNTFCVAMIILVMTYEKRYKEANDYADNVRDDCGPTSCAGFFVSGGF